MTRPTSVDQIRGLLRDPNRRRPPAAPGRPGTRIVVAGRTAVVYGEPITESLAMDVQLARYRARDDHPRTGKENPT